MIFADDSERDDSLDSVLNCNDQTFRLGTVNWINDLSVRVDGLVRAVMVGSVLIFIIFGFILYLIWRD